MTGAAIDSLGRMLATAETFRMMTRSVMQSVADLCGGGLVLAHENGYSKVYVPFCGHAVLEEMSESGVTVADPFAETFAMRQPDARFDAFLDGWLDDIAAL